MAGGVVGVSVNENNDAFGDFKRLLFYSQHLGKKFCGASCIDGKGKFHFTTHGGLVRTNIRNGGFNGFSGPLFIGQTSLKERQPLRCECNWGEYSLIFSGNISNIEEIREKFFKKREILVTGRDVEIFCRIIGKGKNPLNGIKKVYKEIEGAFSLLLLTTDGIYAARSNGGQTPLILGEKDNSIIACSTTTGFSNAGYSRVRDIEPGEIMLLRGGAVRSLHKEKLKNIQCPFFRITYTDNPIATIEGLNIAVVRMNMGTQMALKYSFPDADLVIGVPGSGLCYADGYSEETGLSNPSAAILKYEFATRSYDIDDEELRAEEADTKILLNEALLKAKKAVVIEDSVVRATQLMKLIKKLRDAGVAEIYLLVASPPIQRYCPFDYSTRKTGELATSKIGPPAEIQKYLGVDFLGFGTKEMWAKALGQPNEKWCMHCITK